MKITDKFILRAYIGPMILTFFIVMFILLMQFLWRYIDDIVGKGIPYSVMFELLMYASATFIPMALPLATLLASIMTMGNIGEYNELLALKAAGLSLQRIIRPLVVLMVVVCACSFFIVNDLTPFSWQKMSTIIYDFKTTKHEMKLQDGVFFNGFDNMSIRVDHQNETTKKLDKVLIYNTQNLAEMQTIVADSGYLYMSDDRKFIILELYDGQVYRQNRNYEWYSRPLLNNLIFDYQKLIIPTSGFDQDRSGMDIYKNKGEAMNITQLDVAIDSLKTLQDSLLTTLGNNVIKNYVFKRYARVENLDSLPKFNNTYVLNRLDTMNYVSQNLVFAEAKKSANQARDYMKAEVEQVRIPSMELYRAEENYQKKLALPFSVMIFFLIGAALGAIIKKGGIGLPIVISISFFIFYYIISITGESYVRDGVLPAYIGIWLSSFVLFPIAMFLNYKAANDAQLLNPEPLIILFRKIKGFYKKLFKKNDKNT